MNLTEKIIKEFEEKFVDIATDNGNYDFEELRDVSDSREIKKFLLSSLRQVATEAIEAVRLEKKNDINDNIEFSDGFDSGYNVAISDMSQKAKKFLDENFKS